MKSGMMNGIRLRQITPEAVTRTGSLVPKTVETWTKDDGNERVQQVGRPYPLDATLSNDHRGIIASTIAGIQGVGGQISTSWIDRDES